MNKFFLVLILSFVRINVFALNLEEALTSAYVNNEDLKSARRKFLDEIEAFPQALSSFLPDITAQHNTVVNRTKAKSQYSSAISENKTTAQVLNFNQPIFSGGSSVAALKSAQAGFRASRSNYYAFEQKTILDAINVYLSCNSAKEKYNISETSVKFNAKQLESTDEKFKLGEATLTDVAAAKAAYAKAETDRLNAYADYQASRANFIRIFGIDPADSQIPEVPAGLPKSYEELQLKSKTANLDIETAKHNINNAQASATAEKGNLLPQVSFNVRAERDFFDPETRGNPNNRSVTSSVNVNVPIFTKGGAEYSRIRQAKNKVRLGVIQLDNQIKVNNANCISIWEQFNTSKSRIVAATQATEAAEIAYNGSVQEEIVGSKTILDVLTAEDNLHKAKLSKVDATKDYLLSAYQLKALTGQLTAKSLKLKVKYFSPETEFKRTKMKIIGF